MALETHNRASGPAAADAINAFAFDLHAKACRQRGNLFLSPYGVYTALDLSSLGAAGRTAEQMGAVLHADAGSSARAERAKLQGRLELRREVAFELTSANALWMAKAYPLLPEFVERATGTYRCRLAQLDDSDIAAARETVNCGVAERTLGRIPQLLGPAQPSTRTGLLVTNAICFHARWARVFDEDSTEEGDFTLANGGRVRVPLMYQRGCFGYAEDMDLQIVRLHYEEAAHMLVLLPRRHDGLPRLEISFDAATLAAWTSKLSACEVDLYLSRFRFGRRFELAKVLATMGMPDAFDVAKADFRKMTTAEGLAISDIVHEAIVRVDEKGTEAAAATAMVGVATAARRRVTPVVFRADRPFLFFIREAMTGAILFTGRVADPTR